MSVFIALPRALTKEASNFATEPSDLMAAGGSHFCALGMRISTRRRRMSSISARIGREWSIFVMKFTVELCAHGIRDRAGHIAGLSADAVAQPTYRVRTASPRAQAQSRAPPRQINPSGKSPKTLSSPSRKNIPLNASGKSVLRIRPSHPMRGADRESSRTRGGMRWTRGCD
jgi:hypothetical protein